MSFAAQIRFATGPLTAGEVAASISPILSRRTVEEWIQGRREPPAWAQAWILARIALAVTRYERAEAAREADTRADP